ncbi:MAG: diguanylate cyclase [Clostridia bacterium]|nr:diguanylate cyclase [Clostridia bacterium]
MKGRGYYIVIIDGDKKITRFLSKKLKEVGFTVRSVNNPREAEEAINEQIPDVILIDLSFKDYEGNSFISRIKSKPECSQIPIIALSGSFESLEECDFRQLLNLNDFIRKPIHIAEVLTRINTQIKIMEIQNRLKQKNKELMEKASRLEQAVKTDELTSLYNKKYILEMLGAEIQRSVRYKKPLSVIMLDIDNFKSINDTYGHLAGDNVLKQVAEIIRSSIREIDLAGRYGGEEFVIVAPETSLNGALRLAERIRYNVENTRLHLDNKNKNISATISAGVRCKIPSKAYDISKETKPLIDEADAALYQAKRNGKNRVEVFIPLEKRQHAERNSKLRMYPKDFYRRSS